MYCAVSTQAGLPLRALGAEAVRVAGRIAGDVMILAGEPAAGPALLLEALALRRAGVHFSLSLHVEDERVRLIRDRSREFCAAYATWDEVRLMLDQYAATISETRTTLSTADRAALVEAMRLADSLIVRSWLEHGRLTEVVGPLRREAEIIINDDLAVPAHVFGERTDVVVYAPEYRADELGAFVTALCDLEVPVTIIARDRPTIGGRVRFVGPEGAVAALGHARLIVDATSNDPGVALALAKLGRPLAVSSAGGATEILRGVSIYVPWDRRSILSAVANGLSGAPPVICVGRWEDRPSRRAQPVRRADDPLVSIVVATYNRPQLLAETLQTIERQTYSALEIIVVNDGGCDVRNVVARFPRARLIDEPSNAGPAAARNRGLCAARGTFATFFDDDDEMFPDHIATLVNALERSGLDVAYGQLINCFAVRTGSERRPTGALAGHTALLDHADIQWAGSLATTAVLFRRAIVDRIGTLDEGLVNAEDYEFWLRLAAGREWARVSDVTSVYFIHEDRSSYSAKDGVRRFRDAHQAIYAKHPSPRPLVHAGRVSMLEYFAQASS